MMTQEPLSNTEEISLKPYQIPTASNHTDAEDEPHFDLPQMTTTMELKTSSVGP